MRRIVGVEVGVLQRADVDLLAEAGGLGDLIGARLEADRVACDYNVPALLVGNVGAVHRLRPYGGVEGRQS